MDRSTNLKLRSYIRLLTALLSFTDSALYLLDRAGRPKPRKPAAANAWRFHWLAAAVSAVNLVRAALRVRNLARNGWRDV